MYTDGNHDNRNIENILIIPQCSLRPFADNLLYQPPTLATGDLLTLTVWIINCGKFWKRWEYQTTWPASWETCIQVRKQQLELDMEQQTDSK